MYNRYIRNDNGSYTRIPEEEEGGPLPGGPLPSSPPPGGPSSGNPPPGSSSSGGSSHFGSSPGGPPPGGPPPPRQGRPSDSLTGLLRRLLDQLNLEHVDTGDLLLLALLFFLSREDADEELLAALGLLLIL